MKAGDFLLAAKIVGALCGCVTIMLIAELVGAALQTDPPGPFSSATLAFHTYQWVRFAAYLIACVGLGAVSLLLVIVAELKRANDRD